MSHKIWVKPAKKFLLEGYMALTLLCMHVLVRYAIFHGVGSDAYSLPHKGYVEVMTTVKRTIVFILLMLVNNVSDILFAHQKLA